MSYFGMYLLTIVDNLTTFSNKVAFLSAIPAIVCTAVEVCYRFDNIGYRSKVYAIKSKYIGKIRNKFLIAASIFTAISVFIPSSKAVAFIYIAPQIIENGAVKDTVKNIPELTKLGTDYLKELLKEKVQDVKQW